MKRYYILLIYYEDYLDSAISLYEKFADLIPGLELIIVDNSKNQHIKTNYPHRIVLSGDNRLFEFSGWQKGIDYLHSRHSLSDSDLIFFANDTAARHRYFTFIDRFLFARALKQAQQGEHPYLIGEVNYVKSSQYADTRVFSRWVSTYLFVCSGSYLCHLGLNITFGINKQDYVTAIEHNRICFTQQVPEELSSHINAWLFPPTGRKGWYKSGNATPEQKAAKSLTILCERNLSARTPDERFIHDVYGSMLARKYKRRMNRLFRKLHRGF